MRLKLRGAATAAAVININNTAGIDGVIRRIQALVTAQRLRQAGIGQLVVGGPGDNRRTQDLQGLLVDDAAHGARCEHIDIQSKNPLLADGRCAQLLDRTALIGLDNIAYSQLGTGCFQLPGEVKAHLPEALNRDLEAAQIITLQTVFDRSLDADKHPKSRGR